jgi:hypothetical protein
MPYYQYDDAEKRRRAAQIEANKAAGRIVRPDAITRPIEAARRETDPHRELIDRAKRMKTTAEARMTPQQRRERALADAGWNVGRVDRAWGHARNKLRNVDAQLREARISKDRTRIAQAENAFNAARQDFAQMHRLRTSDAGDLTPDARLAKREALVAQVPGALQRMRELDDEAMQDLGKRFRMMAARKRDAAADQFHDQRIGGDLRLADPKIKGELYEAAVEAGRAEHIPDIDERQQAQLDEIRARRDSIPTDEAATASLREKLDARPVTPTPGVKERFAGEMKRAGEILDQLDRAKARRDELASAQHEAIVTGLNERSDVSRLTSTTARNEAGMPPRTSGGDRAGGQLRNGLPDVGGIGIGSMTQEELDATAQQMENDIGAALAFANTNKSFLDRRPGDPLDPDFAQAVQVNTARALEGVSRVLHPSTPAAIRRDFARSALEHYPPSTLDRTRELLKGAKGMAREHARAVWAGQQPGELGAWVGEPTETELDIIIDSIDGLREREEQEVAFWSRVLAGQEQVYRLLREAAGMNTTRESNQAALNEAAELVRELRSQKGDQ